VNGTDHPQLFYDGQLLFSSLDVGSCCLGIVVLVVVVVVELPTKEFH
jgi:hypothetical protein